ncbi:MAG: menaquinone biosynthesis decarboxylase [Bacteroidetes bacterium CG2_30_32_10]|nr:MAG: menaquinone biosynthesis decarboxylase [Bacteroidetes bacterium CG2_30_32_10]
MAYKSLQQFIEKLDSCGELVRIKEYVSPILEIAEITDRISKNKGKALLFENTGKEFPLLINAMGSYKRICLALGVNNLDDIGKEIEKLLKEFSSPKNNLFDKLKMLPKLSQMSSWMPKLSNISAICQEVIIREPDLEMLPILQCWPFDGGKFITLPLVHTKDPNTGIRNVGMYRMQVFQKDITGMHWHLHKGGAKHFQEYKQLGKKMPIAVVLGGDPVYTYAATAPLPENIDEYMLAGFLRKEKVELVKCITQDIEVPSDADFVIEGYVNSNEELIWEGPFGDHTGYYSLPDWYPKFHITCITHRKDAIYPATIVGIPPQEDAWIGKATERIFLTPIKMTLCPEIIDMDMPIEGVFHNIAIIKIHKTYAGQALKVMNALWGAGQMMFNKILIVVDDTIDIHNYKQLIEQLVKQVDVSSDIHFFAGPMDVLDHSSTHFAYGSKMGIDATIKLTEEINDFSEKIILMDESKINTEALKQKYTDIKAINTSLLSNNIPIVFVSIEKSKPNQVKEIHSHLTNEASFNSIKCVLYFDSEVDLDDIRDMVWRFANNIDPRRDTYFVKIQNNTKIGFDATGKTKKFDNFKRDWPNIIVMDDTTIENIDKKWDKFKIGSFISSPSLKYKKQIKVKGYKL